MIRTTIYIDNEVHQRLKDEAEKRGVEIEEVILALMRHYSEKHKKEIVSWNTVKYQERNNEKLRERVHVRWFGHEYEFLIDLRKVHKQSVSKLISEVVMLLLDEIISYIDHILDNYQNYPYAIAKFNVHNIIGCIILWGYPIKELPE